MLTSNYNFGWLEENFGSHTLSNWWSSIERKLIGNSFARFLALYLYTSSNELISQTNPIKVRDVNCLSCMGLSEWMQLN